MFEEKLFGASVREETCAVSDAVLDMPRPPLKNGSFAANKNKIYAHSSMHHVMAEFL
jgi:hypothetical protein